MRNEPVLLVHGLGSSFDHGWREPGWVDLLTDAAKTVLSVDLLGHGSAAKPHEPDAYTDLENCVSAVLPDEPVDAVGFSLGGQLLLRLAAADPKRFGKLVVIGVGANLFRDQDEQIAALADAFDHGAGDEDVYSQVFVRFAEGAGNDTKALAACLRRPLVSVTPEELAALRPERSRTIEIQDFVSLDDIDPVYFDRSYLVSPQRGAGAEKPYGLLLRAMQRSRRVGIGTFVLSSKAHLAAIRPREDVLVLETLFFADEVRSISEIGYAALPVEPAPRELDVAMKLIDLLATEWDPSRYRDAFREEVLGLIESKAAGAGLVRVEGSSTPPSAGVADLMAALQASVENVRKRTSAGPRTRRRRSS